MADSRPGPGPLTSTSTDFKPISLARFAASVPATWAAKGVDLREPLYPTIPGVDQVMVLPCLSVMLITVLLKLARMCATPAVTPLRTFSFLQP